MAEYIEKNEAIVRLTALEIGIPCATMTDAKLQIADTPAADVAPVVHGRWVKHTRIHGFVYCSACKDVYLDEEWLRDGKWGYCPNCGAKMDGVE